MRSYQSYYILPSDSFPVLYKMIFGLMIGNKKVSNGIALDVWTNFVP